MDDIWAQITGKVRMQSKNAYVRDLWLANRVRYVHTCLLAKIWYTVQIFPSPSTYTQQLTTAITWYIMARGNLSNASIYAPETEKARRMGSNRHRGKV
jgi:hypothetical protein